MINFCNICNQRVANHDRNARCNLCNTHIHLKCLPIYNEEDNNYATSTTGHWTCTKCLSEIFPFYDIDDIAQTIQHSNEQEVYNIESLNNMIFNPTDLNEEDSNDDLDPDNNYYNPLINQQMMGCKYYRTHELNTQVGKNLQTQFSLLNMNIRSLPKKLQ
jgi:hypothetical protein